MVSTGLHKKAFRISSFVVRTNLSFFRSGITKMGKWHVYFYM